MKRFKIVLVFLGLFALTANAQEYTSRYFHYNQYFDAPTPFTITATTIDGADTNAIQICGGGTVAGTRGSYITLEGNDVGGVNYGGDINIIAGVGASSTAGQFPTITIANSGADASDWGQTNILGGGGTYVTTGARGSQITVSGNENALYGNVDIRGGDNGNGGSIRFYAGANNLLWSIPRSGGSATTSDLIFGISSTASQIATIRGARADNADDGILQLTGGGSATVAGTRGAYIQLEGSDIGGTNKGGDINIVAGVGASATSGEYPIINIFNDTVDASDWGMVKIASGGAASTIRGGSITLYGNENSGAGGALAIYAGNVATGHIYFNTSGVTTWTIPYSGSATVVDLVAGVSGTASSVASIRFAYADGSDTGTLKLLGGGADGTTRGAGITLLGDDVGGAGAGAGITFEAGTGTAGTLKFNTAGSNKWIINADGTLDAAITDIGWRIAAGANTACTTTCGASKGCVFGQDTAALTYAIVACNNATADICVCTTT